MFKKLLFALFLFPLFTLAQSNYKPGLIVTLKGDTVHGFVDYKEWENNPGSINFKSSASASAQQYTPNEIKYFQVDQLEYYKAYNGKISTDATNLSHLSTGKDTSFKTAAVFLKLEQDGKHIALYSYADDLKKRYFIVEKTNNEPFELIYRTYNNLDQTYINVIETKYKGQLIYLSSKYDSNTDDIKKKIENSSYDQSLIDVVNKINHNTARPASAKKKSSISFYAGLHSGKTSITPPDYDGNIAYKNVSAGSSYLPGVLLGINVYTNPEVGRLVFRGEIGFSPSSVKTSFSTPFGSTYGSDARSYFTVDQYTLSLSPQVLYNIYNSNSFKFYLECGVSANFSKYSDEKLYNGLYNTTTYGYTPFSTKWISIPLSAGITLKNRVGIFATYTPPVTISDDGNYTYSSIRFGVSYTFGRK
ncbi:MAG TPA: hypothetical protein VGN20_00665 [Mucilaginibacter sp.]